MAAKIRFVEAQAQAASGNQDITISGFGTPVFAIVWASHATTLNTDYSDDASFCMGMTDGTTTSCHFTHNEKSFGNTDNGHGHSNQMVWIADPGTSSTLRDASVSFITDGIRLNWTQAAGHQPRLVVMLVTGTSADVSLVSPNGTPGNKAYATPGFQTKLAFFANGKAPQNTTNMSTTLMCMGLMHYNGTTITQRLVGIQELNNIAQSVNTNPYCRTETDADVGFVALEINQTNGGKSAGCKCTAVTSTQIELETWTDDLDGGIVTVGSLLLADEDVQIGTIDSPTSAAANWTSPSLGFQPQAFGCILTRGTAINTNSGQVDANAGLLGVYVADTDGAEYSCSHSVAERTTGSVNPYCRTDSKLYATLPNGSTMWNASSPDFNADNFQITAANITTVDTTARKWVYWAVEETGTTPQKTASDSSSFITAAEDDLETVGITTFDQGNIQDSIPGTILSQTGGRVDGDANTLGSTETGSVFSNLLFKSGSDSASFSTTESNDISVFGTTSKSASDTASTLGSTESSSKNAVAPITQKSGSDTLLLDDSRWAQYIGQSYTLQNTEWTRTDLSIVGSFYLETGDPDDLDNVFGTFGASKVSVPLAGGTPDLAQVHNTLDYTSSKHSAFGSFKFDAGTPPFYFYLKLENHGALDLSAWWYWDGTSVTLSETGTDVVAAGAFEVPGQNFHYYYIDFLSDAADLDGTLRFGISDASGGNTVAAYTGDEKTLRVHLFGITKGYLSENTYQPTWSVSNFFPDTEYNDRELVQQKLIDQFVSSSDALNFSASENYILEIAGTLTFIRNDDGTFTLTEIASRFFEKFAVDNSQTAITATESSIVQPIWYDPTWESDDVPWGGLLLGAKDLAPIYSLDTDFYAIGLGPDVPLQCFIERRAVVFDRGNALIGRFVFPQIIGPDGGSVWISLGGHNTPDGQVDWEGPYEFKIGEDISVDFAVAGRYLAIRFESTETPVWDLQSFDVDYEVTGVY
jgi:hypothetical protein